MTGPKMEQNQELKSTFGKYVALGILQIFHMLICIAHRGNFLKYYFEELGANMTREKLGFLI